MRNLGAGGSDGERNCERVANAQSLLLMILYRIGHLKCREALPAEIGIVREEIQGPQRKFWLAAR
jgi:hypothetical protein